jgi:hypothetical protein
MRRLIPGFDFLADGAHVILPPAADRTWLRRGALTPLPDWLY